MLSIPQSHNTIHETLNIRLEKLAQYDELSAEFIKKALEESLCDQKLKVIKQNAISQEIASWLDENHSSDNPELIVIAGSITPYELEAILKSLPDDSRVVLLERNPEEALILFKEIAIEEEVGKGRIGLAFGDSVEHIEDTIFKMLSFQTDAKIRILDTQRSAQKDAQFYLDALRHVSNNVRLDVFNAGTLIIRGPLWQFNTLANLPYLLQNPGLNALEGAFAGYPAVVVAAGPSLDNSLNFLKNVAENFVIITTATALKALKKKGIKPALVVAVDGSHLTAPQFTTECDDFYLTCSSLVFPPVIPRFKGIFSGELNANPIDQWLASMRGSRGYLFAGGTVTASAMDIARLMGCKPVITVGLDLAFKNDGTTHASNTMYDGHKLDPQTLIRVPGNFEEEVLTTMQFRCYINLIEKYLRKNPNLMCLNANTGGARITGMPVIKPEKIKEYAAANKLNAYEKIAQIHNNFTPEPIDNVKKDMEQIIDEMAEIITASRSAAMLCNHAIITARQPSHQNMERLKSITEELTSLDDKINSHNKCIPFIKMSLWPASFKINAKPSPEEERLSETERVFRRVRELYEQTAGSAKWTRDLLKNALQRLTDAEALKIVPIFNENL